MSVQLEDHIDPGETPCVSIVSPTRNEAGNIEEFAKRVSAALEHQRVDWEIVFADDSDDATPEAVAAMAARGVPVRCVHREPGDRQHSIAGAIKHALATIDSDIVVVIDADLQHPPEVLSAMIGPIVKGAADFVIGTRYAAQGSADGLGSQWRQVASRSSAAFTKLVFPQFWRCTDLASGLFAFRVSDMDLAAGRTTGFKFLPEALVRCSPTTVAEVPYAFEERFDGLSKARLRDGLTLARSLLGLRLVARQLRPIPLADGTWELDTVLDGKPPVAGS